MRLKFPIAGIHKGFVTSEQPQLTSSDMNNVRPIDTLGNRIRGGQRPAVVKWGDGDQIGDAEFPVVAMCTVSSIE